MDVGLFAVTVALQAHLCGGSLVRLLDESHPGLLEVSYVSTS